MIYKNVRKEIDKDEQVQREQAYKEKMSDLERKQTLKDAERKILDQQKAKEEEERLRIAALKQQESKNFLDNIKTYNVD